MAEIKAEWIAYFKEKGVAEVRWQEANRKFHGTMAEAARSWIADQEKLAEASKDSLARDEATASMNEAKRAHALSRIAVGIAFAGLLLQAAQYFWPRSAPESESGAPATPTSSEPNAVTPSP